MTVTTSKSKNATSYYIKKSLYNDGKITSKVVEKLGNFTDLEERFGKQDTLKKLDAYVKELTRKEKEGKQNIMVAYSPSKLIEENVTQLFNCGYFFLQIIYRELGIENICQTIQEKCNYDIDLNDVLSRLIYGRILFPASKRSTFELSKRLIEQPHFELHQIYRSLGVLGKETDFIQAELYKNSTKLINRKTGILYYDCTNYFFEIEQEEGLKQYGYSKEHRPNPIVQMGLFMDGDGMPLAFCINEGNTNEQITMKPLEKKILSDFALSKFVVCTDAGLASADNRKYNDMGGRAFITTQSIKKLKQRLQAWALNPTGWKLPGKSGSYDISQIENPEYLQQVANLYGETINPETETFYKEQWIKDMEPEQKMLVTYSLKYRNYQRGTRTKQVERARKMIAKNPTKLKKANQNDFKRFISKTAVTDGGEVAERELLNIDLKVIEAEEALDGFYAVCTNLDDDAQTIIKVNHRRWEIEECFRIIKSEFKARPVYLRRDDRIKAHFTTCFISLLIYRILEKRLGERFTCSRIISELRDMNMLEVKREGFIPVYKRTDFTDALHVAFGLRTDYQITSHSKMKKIVKLPKT